MDIQTKIKRIDRRDWNYIKAGWIESGLPEIVPPGAAPEYPLNETHGLAEVVNNVPNDGELKTSFDIIRPAIFHEGFYLFHKSINIAASTEIQINNGLLSWSLSNGYHSAFFCAKAILCFLGISLFELSDKWVLVDIWPETEKLSSKKVRLGNRPIQETKFIRMPRIQHLELWKIFQRTINTFNIDFVDQRIVKFLTSLDPKQFAKQRNSLHYRNDFWPFNDLHYCLINKDFALKENLLNNFHGLEEDDDFSVILSYLLINICYKMLEDITKTAIIIKDEFELVKMKLIRDAHQGYSKTASCL
ncbi:hypothetical protein C0389_05730 [bacterium]|nr:hypothetical protein [bacterium]